MESERNTRENKTGRVGFTLIELLVVLVIMGMIATLLTIAVSKTLKRQRLGTAAEQLASTIQKAFIDTSINQREVFVQVETTIQPDGSRLVNLVDDTNENGALDSTDKVLETFKITSDLVLSNSTATATAWPVVNGALVLGCDAAGRAVNPTTNKTMDHDVLLSLTHKEMLTGNLKPGIRYYITVFPIWKTTKTEARY